MPTETWYECLQLQSRRGYLTSGDDLVIFLFFLSLAFALGLEAVKAETAARRISFTVLSGACLLAGVFWLQIKKIWPPFTDVIISVATNPSAWFVILMFILAVFAFHHPKTKNTVNQPKRINGSKEQETREQQKEQSKPKEPREFVDTTPEYLLGLRKDLSSFQYSKLVEPYIGKWLSVTGTVDNICDGFVVLREQIGAPATFLYFDDAWKDRFHTLETTKKNIGSRQN